MTRKIIQIVMGHDIRGHVGDLVALCDDGSLWLHREGIPWTRLADILQPKEAMPLNLCEAERSLIDESDF